MQRIWVLLVAVTALASACAWWWQSAHMPAVRIPLPAVIDHSATSSFPFQALATSSPATGTPAVMQ